MPINYFWWCSHWASSFLGYISPESKKKSRVFFPIMPAKEERNVLWFGFFKWRKPGAKKKIQYIFGEKQPKLARNKFKTWISSFSPSCFVWRKLPPFGTPQKCRQRENFLKQTSLAAQVSQHFALKMKFLRGVLGIRIFKKSADSTMASPKSPRFWSDQTSKPLKSWVRLFVGLVSINDTTPRIQKNMAGWENHQFEKRRYIDSKAWDPAWGTSSTSSCDLTSMDLPSCSLWMVASPAPDVRGHVIPFSPIKSHGSVPISIPRVCDRCHLTVSLMVGDSWVGWSKSDFPAGDSFRKKSGRYHRR